MSELIGILGGTFDPIHYGHLRPALEIMQQQGLQQVRFLPNNIPPHRTRPWLDSNLRRQLVQQAIADVEDFVLDERELNRDGPSYMVDTLSQLKQEFPDQGLCLILGQDAFAGITSWHRWRDIFQLAHLLVASRPGSQQLDFGEHNDWLQSRTLAASEQLSPRHTGQILLQSVTLLDISASKIRTDLAQGNSIRYLVPEQVREILEKYANR